MNKFIKTLCNDKGIEKLRFRVNYDGTVHINEEELNLTSEEIEQFEKMTFDFDDFGEEARKAYDEKVEKEITDKETEQYYDELDLAPVPLRFSIAEDGKVTDMVIDFR